MQLLPPLLLHKPNRQQCSKRSFVPSSAVQFVNNMQISPHRHRRTLRYHDNVHKICICVHCRDIAMCSTTFISRKHHNRTATHISHGTTHMNFIQYRPMPSCLSVHIKIGLRHVISMSKNMVNMAQLKKIFRC